MEKLTRNIEIKKPLSQEQKNSLFDQISDADLTIQKIEEELDAFKDKKKAEKEEQEQIINEALANYRRGYIAVTIECTAKYVDGIASFYNAKTGEKVDERPITPEEQLQLSEHRTDAEALIREDSKKEDTKGKKK